MKITNIKYHGLQESYQFKLAKESLEYNLQKAIGYWVHCPYCKDSNCINDGRINEKNSEILFRCKMCRSEYKVTYSIEEDNT